jgi:hypothetical protein
MVFRQGGTMNQARVDLFTFIHKGLRASMFATAGTVARTDFGDPEQSRVALERVHALIAMLREHGLHEDVHMLPLLSEHDRALADSLGGDHAGIEALHQELAHLAARAESAAPAERVSLASTLLRRLNRLIATQLAHMDREEGEATAALWAGCTDDELTAVRVRITESIPPARRREMVALILPALNAVERAAFIAALPPEARGALAAMAAMTAAA